MEISCLFAPNHHCCWNITASVTTINVLNEEQASLNNIKREMVTSNFSLLLSCLLMCVFIFNGRPAWVPHSSAASPAGGEELAWLEGAAESRRSILFWVTGSREVSSWPEVVIYLVAWQLLGVRSGYPAASQSFMDELSGSAAPGEIPATSTG